MHIFLTDYPRPSAGGPGDLPPGGRIDANYNYVNFLIILYLHSL